MSTDSEMSKFHRLCEVSIIVEADGSNPVLCVSANVRDNSAGGQYREFKRSIALTPVMRAIANKIREYHNSLHVSGGLPQGQDPLEIAGWFDSIKRTARHLAEAKAVKSLYGDLKKYGNEGAKWADAHKNQLSMAAALIPGAGPAMAAGMQTSFRVYDALKAAKQGHPEAIAALEKIKQLAESGDPKAQHAFSTAQNMNEMMKAKEGGMQVAGWLYNKPYRTNAQTLMDGISGKFPTVSMALREGWHDGMNFVTQMKRKNYGFQNLLGA